jgi:eukaryotic-like serine/threonine-protein kinase
MAKLGSCPSRDELQRMVLGNLPDQAAQRIQSHLEQCPNCCVAVDQCVASDEFLAALRGGRRLSSEPTKTMYAPIQCIRGALSTWSQGHESTQSGKSRRHFSTAEINRLLSPPESIDEIGRLGDFRVMRALGSGGFAVVFEAEDSRLKRRVALKLLHPAIAARNGGVERFLREAQSAAALKHEHVVTIYQVGMQGETPFIAMELLDGETLEDSLIRERSLRIGEVVRIGREITSGLVAAHARGLLHRDIKPANIWLERPETPNPAQPVQVDQSQSSSRSELGLASDFRQSAGKVKILDFGCAKSWADEVAISEHGLLIGTPAYMAPEQFSGDAVDPRTDLFSLGCVLYQMAAGRRPFGGENIFSMVRSLALEEPVPLRTINPQVPRSLSDLVDRLLSKSLDARPATAQAVLFQLRAIEESLRHEQVAETAAANESSADSRPPRGHYKKWALGAGICLAALIPLVYFLVADQLIPSATTTSVDPKRQETAKFDRDRTVASWVLSTGGFVTVEAGQPPQLTQVSLGNALPSSSFKLRSVNLQARALKDADAGLMQLSGLKHLRTLQLSEQPVSDAGLAAVRDLNQLQALSLDSTKLTDAGLAHLKSLKNLRELNLSWTHITDAGLKQLEEKLPQLESLYLRGLYLSDAGLIHLRGFKKLKTLYLSGQPVTNAGLAHIISLAQLDSLGLSSTQVTDAGLADLSALKDLRFLNLDSTPVTDAGLAHLRKLPRLEILSLGATRVSEAGLVELQGMKLLHILVLKEATQISDAAIPKLQALRGLTEINLTGTRITPAGIATLKTSLPQCRIITSADARQLARP